MALRVFTPTDTANVWSLKEALKITEEKLFPASAFGESISVFFPCYNEQANVETTTQKAVEVLDKIKADYEIIIVNDGSSDNTAGIAENLAQNNERIKVINHPANIGYGGALQSGFRAASKNMFFTPTATDNLISAKCRNFCL